MLILSVLAKSNVHSDLASCRLRVLTAAVIRRSAVSSFSFWTSACEHIVPGIASCTSSRVRSRSVAIIFKPLYFTQCKLASTNESSKRCCDCSNGGGMASTMEVTDSDKKLFEDASKLKPIVISGPSGGGKSTLLKKLLGKYPDCFGFSVSHTTRQPRPGEQHGKDYYYVSREEFLRMKENREFIETTEFSANFYATSKRAVSEVLEAGRMCVLDVDMQGVKNVKSLGIPATFVFVKPPSLPILEERLRGRGTESEEKIAMRLEAAKEALAYAEHRGVYDLVVVNDDFETAYEHFEGYFAAAISELQKAKFRAKNSLDIAKTTN